MTFTDGAGWGAPLQLLWLPVVVALSWWLWRRQDLALRWIGSQTSRRFRHLWTRHSRRSLLLHLALLAAAATLLAFAAARPYSVGEIAPRVEERTILLLIDASLSMAAKDAPPRASTTEGGEPTRITRLQYAAGLAQELIAAQPGAQFALISFSGAPVIHSPPTRDHHGLQSLLAGLRLHLSVPTSGTRFSSAFQAAAEMISEREEAVDVVLLSDGELPEPDAVDEGLRLLELRGTPVHTIGIGGTEPVGMRLFDLESVLGPGDRTEIGTYRTKREDDELLRIAERTRAAFLIPQEGDRLETLLAALSPAALGQGIGEQGRADRAHWFLLGFAVLFLYELLWLSDRSRRCWIDGHRPPPNAHDWLEWRAQQRQTASATPEVHRRPLLRQRTMPRAALALAPFLLLSECAEPFGSAWRVMGSAALNELGRVNAEDGQHVAAKLAFRQAAALGWHREVSLSNLGSVQLRSEEIERAHATFERALRLSPAHRAASFNDGWALYLWGERELDEEACETARTRVLWEQAQQRFATAARAAWWFTEAHRLASAARENEATFADHLLRLDAIDERCAAPPEAQQQQPETPPEQSPPPPAGGEPDGDSEQPPPQAPGGSAPESPPGAEPPPPPISDEEREQIAAALERIRSTASGASGFHQTGATQLNPDNAKQGRGLQRKW